MSVALAADIHKVTSTPLWSEPVQQAWSEQAIELLDSLGYIDVNLNTDYDLKNLDINSAISRLKRDVANSVILKILSTETKVADEDLNLEKLAELTAIDGSFPLSAFSIEQIARDPILVRILNFRLVVLGVITKHPGKQFYGNTKSKLKWLAKVFKLKVSDMLALTDDFEQLMCVFSKIQVFADTDFTGLVFFENPVDSNVERNFRNSKRFIHEAEETASVLAEDQLRVIRRCMSGMRRNSRTLRMSTQRKIRDWSADSVALLAARLVQIKLLLLGNYDGKLDAKMHSLSLLALKSFCEMTNHEVEEEASEKVDIKRFLVKLNDHWWALNTTYFFGLQEEDTDTSQHDEKAPRSIADHIQKLSDELPEQDRSKLFDAVENEVHKRFQVGKRPKQTKTSRGFFQRIGSFFKKIYNAVVRGIKAVLNAIKKLFEWVKNGIRILLQEIAKAVRSLKTAISFVFSERVLSTDSIVTHFDGDFDAITSIRGQEAPEAFSKHIEKLQSQQQEVLQSANILNHVLPLIIRLLKPPFGWLAAATELVRMWLVTDEQTFAVRLARTAAQESAV